MHTGGRGGRVEHGERLGHGSVDALGSDVMTLTQPREPASRLLRVSSLDVDRRVRDWAFTDFGLC